MSGPDRDHHEGAIASVSIGQRARFNKGQIKLSHANLPSISQSMGAQIGALVLATSGVQLAVGFFGTFISLRVPLENFTATMSALVLSGYFAGYTIGAVCCARIIERVGHIRSYAAFAGLAVTATALMPLAISGPVWLVLRAIVGFGCAGLFITTEGWLNAKAAPAERGRILSIYRVGIFTALAIGQILISQVDIKGSAAFNIIVAIFAVALALVSLTRAEPPQITTASALPYGQLARTAPVAVAGAAVSGLIVGAFYALVPAWMQGRGNDRATIGLVMLASVLGGLAFQIPAGRLSDRFDRRMVLAGLCLGLVGTSIALVHLPRSLLAILPTAFLFGGFLSTLYPVSVAYAHDSMRGEQVVAVSGRLILLFGLGSILGPLLGTSFVTGFGINGVLYLIATVALLLALFAAARSLTSTSPPHVKRQVAPLTPQPAINSRDEPPVPS
jgi:MFS family permease